MGKIYKDYNLIGNLLTKVGIDDNKHLLWQYGGVPAVDANLWDKYQDRIEKMIFRTRQGRSIKTTKRIFNANKQEINFGFGRQYYMPKKYWDYYEPVNQNDNQSHDEEEDTEALIRRYL